MCRSLDSTKNGRSSWHPIFGGLKKTTFAKASLSAQNSKRTSRPFALPFSELGQDLRERPTVSTSTGAI